jgi:hypothetical protein
MARAAVRALLANRIGLQIGHPASLEAQAFVTPDVLLCPFRIERIGISPNLTPIKREVPPPAPRAGTYINELRHSAGVHRGIGRRCRNSPTFLPYFAGRNG